MQAVLQLRGSNTATVKEGMRANGIAEDIVDLQKLIVNHFKYLERHLAAPSEDAQKLMVEVTGTNAIKTVVRSILTAEASLNNGGWRDPCRLALSPSRVLDEPREDVGERRGLQLCVRCTTGLPPPVQGEIRVARGTNVGLLAGAIAKRLRSHGAALVRGAGAVALKHQLRAVAIASGYLAERGELENCDLVVLPRFEEVEVTDASKKLTENLLTVYKLPHRDSQP
ncbi:unnamed protein product [Effrenium voratum]|uniref:Uncharacterized protein n=1 Tax=Effrenium voratum TaxID=2562239 RepID=A0AA36MY92_9DINO|nr:unnamed protein product [Effrenium voratum]